MKLETIRSLNKRWLIYTLAVIVVAFVTYWFFGKFFPAQIGEWKRNVSLQEELAVPISDWEGNIFWTSLDFPGRQNVCVNFSSFDSLSSPQNFSIPVTQTWRDDLYPLAGDLQALFSDNSLPVTHENILQNKPFLLGQLEGNIMREGKDLFFAAENEKFLISNS